MSSAIYTCYLADPFGVRLADASNFISLKYTRTVNDVGTMTLILPGSFSRQYIRAPDGRVEIWRRQQNTSREILVTDTTWLIKKVDYARDDNGQETIVIEADTPLSILREPGRFINYDADSTDNTAATDIAADDIIKSVARRNIGSSDTSNSAYTRDLSAYLSIAPNISLGATLSKSYPWRECLKVMQELANASTQAGVYLAFDIVAPSPDTLEFRTYTQQRGVDRRFPGGLNPIIIGPDFGNMGGCTLSYDWRNEITYALAAGRGTGSDRVTAEAADTARIAASPFGLREKFVNAAMYTTVGGLSEEAKAVVRQGRPKTLFRGKILDVPGSRYGVHWGWGDYVTVQAFGKSFDARIEAITVTVARGKETIDAWVRADS